jgi:hypothetical protein
MQRKFIGLYDSMADDIFAYSWEHTADRSMAEFLTKAIFKETWDKIAEEGKRISSFAMKTLLFRVAREHISSFSSKIERYHFSEKLWNLTLSQ